MIICEIKTAFLMSSLQKMKVQKQNYDNAILLSSYLSFQKSLKKFFLKNSKTMEKKSLKKERINEFRKLNKSICFFLAFIFFKKTSFFKI